MVLQGVARFGVANTVLKGKVHGQWLPEQLMNLAISRPLPNAQTLC